MSNVRVCARYRPINKVEKSTGQDQVVITIADDCETTRCGIHTIKPKTFQFDRVFPATVSQEEVFKYTALPLVESVLEGFNCTLFVYGQTGSGKTFSMEGDLDDPVLEGLIPRMTRAVFDNLFTGNNPQVEGYTYTVQVSYIEIYNEKLKDLLNPGGPQLKIRDFNKKSTGGVTIENIHAEFVGDPEEVFTLLHKGHLARAVTATRMNEGSSRSHAVFMLQLEGTHAVTQSKKRSKLMMVDLAGSEKIRKTQATGQTLKEAQQINKSLMVLGLVINSLVEGKTHIPYRDSKLTRLLSDALGGNSKTCLIVTASPAKYNSEETISTMRFGQRAKAIKNKAKVNAEYSVAEYKKMLAKANQKNAELTRTVKILSAQLAQLKELLTKEGIDFSHILKNIQIPSDDPKPKKSKSSGKGRTTSQVVSEVEQNDSARVLELEQERDALKDSVETLKKALAAEQTRQQLEAEEKGNASDDEHLEQLTERIGELDEMLIRKDNELKLKQYESDTAADQNRMLYARNDEAKVKIQDQTEQLKELTLQIKELTAHVADLEDQMHTQRQLNQEHADEQIERFATEEKLKNPMETGMGGGNESSIETEQQKQRMYMKVAELMQAKKKLQSQNERLKSKNSQLNKKLQMNGLLRQNWTSQIVAMEHAMKLAQEVFSRERLRLEAQLDEKTLELVKMKRLLLMLSSKDDGSNAKRANRNPRASRINKPVTIEPGRGRKRAPVITPGGGGGNNEAKLARLMKQAGINDP